MQRSEPSLLESGESSDPEQTDVLALCLLFPSASREQARVGNHRSVRGCFAWILLLAVLFMQRQGFPRVLQRLWRDGCHLDCLCSDPKEMFVLA
jgi:hypothetical protein